MPWEDFSTYTVVNNYPALHVCDIAGTSNEIARFQDLSNTDPTEFAVWATHTMDLGLAFWWELRCSRNGGGYAFPRHCNAVVADTLGWLITGATIIGNGFGISTGSNAYQSMAIEWTLGSWNQGVQPPNGSVQRVRYDPGQGLFGRLFVDTFGDVARTNLLGTSTIDLSASVRNMTVSHKYGVIGTGQVTSSGSGGRQTFEWDMNVAIPAPGGGSQGGRGARMPMLGTRRDI